MAGGISGVRPPAPSLRMRGFRVLGRLPVHHSDSTASFSLWARKEMHTPRAAGLSLPAVLCGVQVADATAAKCHTRVQLDGHTTSLLGPPTRPQLPVSQVFCLLLPPSSTSPPAGWL